MSPYKENLKWRTFMASLLARIYKPGVIITPRQPFVTTGLSATTVTVTTAVAIRAVVPV